MTGVEPQQLDAAVRLVLSTDDGSPLRESWPDLWDSAHRLVASCDGDALWLSLCRLNEAASGSKTADRNTDTDLEASGGPRPIWAGGLLRHAAYSLLALASLLAGIAVIIAVLIALVPHNTLLAMGQQALGARSTVELLMLAGIAIAAWACLDWLASWGYLTAAHFMPARRLRRTVPFAAAVAVAAIGVLIVVLAPRTSSAGSGTGLTKAAEPQEVLAAVRHVISPLTSAVTVPSAIPAAKATPLPLIGRAPGTARDWALPLAASIIIQGSGLIRPAEQSQGSQPAPSSTPQSPSPTPVAGIAAAPPAAVATPALARSEPGPSVNPAGGLIQTSVAITPAATPAAGLFEPAGTAVAAPVVLPAAALSAVGPAAGPPPPPFALLLAGAPAATPAGTPTSDPPPVSTAAGVRAALPAAASTAVSAAAVSSTDSPGTGTVAAAGPTAPAAHVRFGPPPPSPR